LRKVAIVGVGETKFSAAQEKTQVELFAEAAMEAINESNLSQRIFRLYTWAMYWETSLRDKVAFRALLLRISGALTFRRIDMRVPVLQLVWR